MNQIYHIFHFAIAIGVFFLMLPNWIFEKVKGTGLDRFWANYLRMNGVLMLIGYFLVALKLYEAFGIFIIIFLMIALRAMRMPRSMSIHSILGALFYSFIEVDKHVKQLSSYSITFWKKAKDGIRGFTWSPEVFEVFLLILVMAVTVYVHSYDAVRYAGPALPDGYTGLVWTKYIDERILFHDGIYPQGFYIYIATVGKLALTNLLYVEKYSGAFSNCLLVWSIYYGVRAMTGKRLGGIIGATLYGVFGYVILGDDWVRLGASLSQEFSFVFVIPSIVFIYRYLRTGHKTDLYVTVYGLSAAGLSHPFGYALTGLGCMCVLCADMAVFRYLHMRRYISALVGGGVSVVVTFTPLIMGYILHHNLNGASSTFIGERQPVYYPPINLIDRITLVCLAFLFIVSAIQLLRRSESTYVLMMALFGASMFYIYQIAGPKSQSVALTSRAIDMWALVSCLVIGITIQVLLSIFKSSVTMNWMPVSLIGTSMLSLFVIFPPQPIVPYKLLWNVDVEQYLKIADQYRLTSFLIVAPDQYYALVLGSGYIMHDQDFLQAFNPLLTPLTTYGSKKVDKGIPKNIFIYYPKVLFEVSKSNSIYPLEAPTYAADLANKAALSLWLKRYQQAGHQLSVYYNGPTTEIFHIVRS